MQLQSNFVVIATRNEGKVKEFAKLFGAKGYKVRCLTDYTDLPEIIESGTTFAENARIKAQIISAHLHVPVLADDSGLCVAALDGAPGVYSARFAGENATDADNNAKLLQALSELPNAEGDSATSANPKLLSKASFVCALALIDPVANEIIEAEDRFDGYIIGEARGESGFGYDPLFYLPALDKTMAELTVEEKNEMSHRAKALRLFLDRLPGQRICSLMDSSKKPAPTHAVEEQVSLF
ncbi:RdgB/HAM1 family non-canonical purine NTP pyrophosphatase [Paenibacillus sp. N3.4]|uniref:RdgB/HAM1 family non-canonical purine NTP pyrophosphatase n=1 Tax=Paenibacillus sp. N3.4 TaxID=2603222 RepID=UPI0011C7E97E|nr:RdgB/HAM1 family non-canonical purine NTP pyrophosphatase [Paenibacillus sp. N3.4]TXK84681.1 RdgB/HAM1 family non-canonical purine NTP pyrophosphatase [Paenibacillus sp. N3.4]